MRTVGKRSVVLYIVLGVFIGGLIWFLFRFFTQGETWATQPYNFHLSIEKMGEVRDRDGSVLAKTVDGERIYSDDESTRRALLHTVGDDDGYIGTSVQAGMRAKLSGYNIFTGLGDTPLKAMTSNVNLTIDTDVCVAAYHALDGHNGAVMVYNYETGDMICKVSAPTYDPMYPPENILEDIAYEGVYLDRGFSSAFTPGSIFKIVTQAAAVDLWPAEWRDKQFTCTGSVDISGSTITCMGEHGTISAYEAMGRSCNIYYALLANEIGSTNLQAKAEQYGFNQTHTFTSYQCINSQIDLLAADNVQLGWAGIGQHTTLANPYHILTLMGAIANGGSYTAPRLTKSLDLLAPVTSGNRKYMSSSEAATMKDMLRSNVSNYYGSMFPEAMEVCAKSGTGEVEYQNPNCWMVGFCSNSDYPYAFVAIVEDGSTGAATAGPVIGAVLDAIYAKY